METVKPMKKFNLNLNETKRGFLRFEIIMKPNEKII